MDEKIRHFNFNIFYAPNVKHGGGLALLEKLILSFKENQKIIWFLHKSLSARYPDLKNVVWCDSGLLGRLKAEIKCLKISKNTNRIICFNGVPTFFKTQCPQVVYFQNSLLLNQSTLKKFKLRTRCRLIFERLLIVRRLSKISTCFVQTESMSNQLTALAKRKIKRKLDIQVLPFIPDTGSQEPLTCALPLTERKSFIYLATSDPHKNHINLFRAWVLLAKENIRHTLTVTLDRATLEQLFRQVDDFELISDLIEPVGYLPRQHALRLLKGSRALVFPSFVESFGLPLIEAQSIKVPIIASEKDFVRDACIPSQTFDPSSPRSISDAIKRFLGISDDLRPMNCAQDVWMAFLGHKL